MFCFFTKTYQKADASDTSLGFTLDTWIIMLRLKQNGQNCADTHLKFILVKEFYHTPRN